MREKLIALLAEYLETDPGAIDGSFRFTGPRFQGSIGMLKFQAFARRRLGSAVPAISTGASLDEAIALWSGRPIAEAPHPGSGTAAAAPSPVTPTPTATPRQALVPSSPAGVPLPAFAGRIGIDIESVTALPSASDYRVHEFYAMAFTPAEIAYCILKEDPRIHFCGLFSAKESLKKAAAEFLPLPLGSIEVSHTQEGRPFFAKAGDISLPSFALSISHTPEFAVAVALGIA